MIARMKALYGAAKFRDVFKVKDLLGKPQLFKIADARIETVPKFNKPNETVERLVLHFEGVDKACIVGVMNGQVLYEAWGEFERNYIGREIVLFPAKEIFEEQGEEVEKTIIRMRLPKNRAAPPPPPPVDPATVGDFDDDDIPF